MPLKCIKHNIKIYLKLRKSFFILCEIEYNCKYFGKMEQKERCCRAMWKNIGKKWDDRFY